MANLFKKIQELPEKNKKLIFWAIVVILGIILFSFFIKNTGEKIKGLQGRYFSSEMKIPELQQNINAVPGEDIGSAIKQIQEILNQNKNPNEKESNEKTQ